MALRNIAVAMISRNMPNEALLLVRPFMGSGLDSDLSFTHPMALAFAERGDYDRALTAARSIGDISLRAATLAEAGLILRSDVALEEALTIVMAGAFEQSRDDIRLGTFASVMSNIAAARRDRTAFDRAILAANRMQDDFVRGVRLAGISRDQARAGFLNEAIATARSFSSARGSSLRHIDEILRLQAWGDFDAAMNTASRLPVDYRDRAIRELAVLGAERGRNVDSLITSIAQRPTRIEISARAAYAGREIRHLNRAESELRSALESITNPNQQFLIPERAIEYVAIAQARLGDHLKALATIRLGSIQQRAERLANVAYVIPQPDDATEPSRQRQLIADRLAEEQRRPVAAQRAAEEQSRAREAAQRAAEEQRRREEAQRAAEEQRRREEAQRAETARAQREAAERARQQPAQGQSSIADSQCQTVEQVLLSQTIPFRRRGVPIDIARRPFETFMRFRELWLFSMASVEEIYANPDGLEITIRRGQWRELCVQTVRGF